MFKKILIVCLISLISACNLPNDESSESIDSFEYEGDWGRSFLLYSDTGDVFCSKEIVSITKTTWKLYRFTYLGDSCEQFLSQLEFEGNIVAETDEVVDGLSVKRLLIENIDWVWWGLFEPFDIIPERPDQTGSDVYFEIAKVIFWDDSKMKSFEFDLFQDGDSFFSNIYGITDDPDSIGFPLVDSNSIILDSGYIKVMSIDKEQVDKL